MQRAEYECNLGGRSRRKDGEIGAEGLGEERKLLELGISCSDTENLDTIVIMILYLSHILLRLEFRAYEFDRLNFVYVSLWPVSGTGS